MVKLRGLTMIRLKYGVLLTGFALLVTTLLGRQYHIKAYHSSPLYRDLNTTIGDMGSGHFPAKRLCQAKTHIAYIKVEKTGSSTMSSMLINFGQKRNLTFALSKKRYHFGHEPIRPEHIAPIARGKHYDLLIQHSTFNHTAIKSIFPHDTIILASIREPLSHFVSFYYYNNFQKLLPLHIRKSSNETLKLITFIESSYRKLQSTPLNSREGESKYNCQSRRMGVPFDRSLDADFVRQYIDTVLNPNLEFVLIQEYFDESLVLMKRKLCWDFSDIVYMSHHVQHYDSTPLLYSSTIVSQHKQLAVADYIIYDHFYYKLWKTALEEGADLFEEVRAFKNVKRSVLAFCAGAPNVQEILVISSTRWSDEFTITGQKCLDMTIKTLQFVSVKRAEQMADLDKQPVKVNKLI